jgi:hypothetical protein
MSVGPERKDLHSRHTVVRHCRCEGRRRLGGNGLSHSTRGRRLHAESKEPEEIMTSSIRVPK